MTSDSAQQTPLPAPLSNTPDGDVVAEGKKIAPTPLSDTPDGEVVAEGKKIAPTPLSDTPDGEVVVNGQKIAVPNPTSNTPDGDVVVDGQKIGVPTSVREGIVDAQTQVRFKIEGERLLLILPSQGTNAYASNWSELWQQLKQRLNGGERFWQKQAKVHLMAQDRLLDGQKLQAIADALSSVELQLVRVHTSRRQTAVAAATAGYCVEQQMPKLSLHQAPKEAVPLLSEPLYLQITVRSGVAIRHPGTIVVLGDINPGGEVVADGDIFVWGRLRGVAHAGANGNRNCRIMALQMEPTQLRIAEAVARAPQTPPAQFYPEVAYVTPEGIRITKATDFAKTHLLLNS